jgi:hypothetical protein
MGVAVAVGAGVEVGGGVIVGVGVEVCNKLMMLIGLRFTGPEHEATRRKKRRAGSDRFMYELTQERGTLFFAAVAVQPSCPTTS